MAEETFAAWMARNKQRLLAYEAWEVARLALACGYTMAEIAPDVSEWVSVSRRKLRFWDNPLNIQWLEIVAYQRRGEEWDSI